jgi:hypothetical protein
MGFVKYINFDHLSATDKKALKKLLQHQKKDLLDAMRATDQQIAALIRKPKKAKKAKKAKK